MPAERTETSSRTGRSTWLLTAGLVVLAILAYFGRSLVMLASVGGIAVALWLARRRSLRAHAIAVLVGLINAAAILPLLWLTARAGHRSHAT